MSTWTPNRAVRIPPEMEDAARDAHPELADVSLSVLLRAGLAALAGAMLGDAIRAARESGQKRGPKPRQNT